MKLIPMMRALTPAFIAACALLTSDPATAQTRSQVYGTELDQEAQTVYVRTEAGATAYESDAAGSKETKQSMTYMLGGWFGENRVAGLSITSNTAKVPFTLNKSESDTEFDDVRAMVRLWWLTPSVGVSLSQVDVSNDGTKKVSLYGTGVNAGLGIQIPLYRAVVVYGDSMVAKTTKGYDKISQTTTLGDRSELDAGVSFDVTDKLVDFLVGYRVRKYDIKATDAVYHEGSQGAYAGLRLGLYF